MWFSTVQQKTALNWTVLQVFLLVRRDKRRRCKWEMCTENARSCSRKCNFSEATAKWQKKIKELLASNTTDSNLGKESLRGNEKVNNKPANARRIEEEGILSIIKFTWGHHKPLKMYLLSYRNNIFLLNFYSLCNIYLTLVSRWAFKIYCLLTGFNLI